MRVQVEVWGEHMLSDTEAAGITKLLTSLGPGKVAVHPKRPMWLTFLNTVDAANREDAAAIINRAMTGVNEEFPGSVQEAHLSWLEPGP